MDTHAAHQFTVRQRVTATALTAICTFVSGFAYAQTNNVDVTVFSGPLSDQQVRLRGSAGCENVRIQTDQQGARILVLGSGDQGDGITLNLTTLPNTSTANDKWQTRVSRYKLKHVHSIKSEDGKFRTALKITIGRYFDVIHFINANTGERKIRCRNPWVARQTRGSGQGG